MQNVTNKTTDLNSIHLNTKRFERFEKSNLNKNHINDKVHHLLCRSDIFINAYENLCKNKGLRTLGIKEDEGFLHIKSFGFGFGLEKAEKIAQAFRKRNDQWQALRRTRIPKPRKKKDP